ncbi:MAG: hypothetical protein AB2L07_10670 [Thermoanaerobaculaceae bacterium]
MLADLKRSTGRPVYLATDTHWRPEAAKAVAGALARFVRERVELDEVPDPGVHVGECRDRGHRRPRGHAGAAARQPRLRPSEGHDREGHRQRRPALAARHPSRRAAAGRLDRQRLHHVRAGMGRRSRPC